MPNEELVPKVKIDIQNNTKKKLGVQKSLKTKIEEAKEKQQKLLAELDPLTVPNRIAGILDDSSSTEGECWNREVQAFVALLSQSNYTDTSYLLYKLNEGFVQPLTCDYELIKTELPRFYGGCTPLAEAMESVLDYSQLKTSITRAFIVSDGIPDSPEYCRKVAKNYKNQNIKIDTVFVSSVSHAYSQSNFEKFENDAKNLMRDIANITGGIFMSFDNLGNFSHAIAYLSPAFRDMLEDKKVRLMLGSGE